MASNEMLSTEMVAVTQLASQFEKLDNVKDLETMQEAISSITGIALMSKNPQTKIAVIKTLGNFVGLQPKPQEMSSHVLESQRQATSQILGIAITTKDENVRVEAIDALRKSLSVTDLGRCEKHRMVVIDIATIAVNSGDPVKQKAVEALSDYVNKEPKPLGYVGKTASPTVPTLANTLIGAIAVRQ